MREAARARSVHLQVVEAGDDTAIDAGFAALGGRQIGAVVVQPDPFPRRQARADRRAGRAPFRSGDSRHTPQFAGAGGLISYGNSPTAAYHLEGSYIVRI